MTIRVWLVLRLNMILKIQKKICINSSTVTGSFLINFRLFSKFWQNYSITNINLLNRASVSMLILLNRNKILVMFNYWYLSK